MLGELHIKRGAAGGEMQHGVNRLFAQGASCGIWKCRGGMGIIDNAWRNRMSPLRKGLFKVLSTLAPRQIEKEARGPFQRLDVLGERHRIGGNGLDLRETGLARGLCRACAHNMQRQCVQPCDIAVQGVESMRACGQQCSEIAGGQQNTRGRNLDQRANERLVPQRLKAPGTALRIRLRSCEEDAHGSMGQNIGRRAGQQILPGLHTKPFCVLDRAGELRLVTFCSVDPQDLATERHVPAVDTCKACNRGAARAVEHPQEGALER